MSSSQLTFIFFRGVGIAPTSSDLPGSAWPMVRPLHALWRLPVGRVRGHQAGQTLTILQWMIWIYWKILEYHPWLVYSSIFRPHPLWTKQLNMDDIPVYFMMFVYINIYCLWCLSRHKPHHKHILLQHSTLTAYSSALSILVQTCPNEATHEVQNATEKHFALLSGFSGFLAPGSNPMLVMAWHWFKNHWLSDLGVVSCS